MVNDVAHELRTPLTTFAYWRRQDGIMIPIALHRVDLEERFAQYISEIAGSPMAGQAMSYHNSRRAGGS